MSDSDESGFSPQLLAVWDQWQERPGAIDAVFALDAAARVEANRLGITSNAVIARLQERARSRWVGSHMHRNSTQV
jgi:hypothetical protein